MKLNKKTIVITISLLLILIIGILIICLLSKDKVTTSKKVDGLLITDSKIEYNGEISVLSSNVKNITKEKKEDIKLKITFFNKSKKEITSVTGYLGDIESKQTTELNAAISLELKNVYDIKYEMIK